MKLLVFISFISIAHSRFFDACPGRRISIGACLAGLCPAGSECVNGYCCKLKVLPEVTTELPESSNEVEKYEKCKNGKHAIGECISDNCPSGYKCENGLCCRVGLPPVRVTMIPVELTTKKSIESTVSSSTVAKKVQPKIRVIPEAEEEEEVNENEKMIKKKEKKKVQKKKEEDISQEELTEIEKIKLKFKKEKEIEETSTNEEDYGNELIIEDREEIDDIVTLKSTTMSSSSTTTSPSTTTSFETTTRRKKPKRPRVTTTSTTTTTSQPFTEEGDNLEEEEEEEEDIDVDNETTSVKATSAIITTTTIKTTKSRPDDENIAITGCPVGDSIGECISNQCPEGHGCFQNKCCILTPQINCTDALEGCMSHLCGRRGYKEFMTKNCARTCARCHLTDLDTSEIRECRDRRSDCSEWAQEGFCESTLYTTRQKLKMCGKSCKLC